MFDGFSWGAAYAINNNQREFDREARTLRIRIEQNEAAGDIEYPLQVGMIKTMNALIDELREIDEGRLAPEDARIASLTTCEHRLKKFQDEANASCLRASKGEFELQFQRRFEPSMSPWVTIHGITSDTKRVPVKRRSEDDPGK